MCEIRSNFQAIIAERISNDDAMDLYRHSTELLFHVSTLIFKKTLFLIPYSRMGFFVSLAHCP